MASILTGVAYADLAIPRRLSSLQRVRENHLRKFYVDGEFVQIRRDAVEPASTYAYRASFVVARTFHPRQRLEELVANSRVAANKRWSPAIRDNEGRIIQTPHYVDSVEERYARISGLASLDARIDVIEEDEDEGEIFYEPTSPGSVERASSKLIRTVGGEEHAIATVPETTEEELEALQNDVPLVKVEGEYATSRLGDVYVLVAKYPLYVMVEGKKTLLGAQRLGSSAAQVLQPWYTLYSSQLVGRLGNMGTPKFAVEDGKVVLRVTLPSEEAVEYATRLLSEVIPSLQPLETTLNGKRAFVHYF